jgi:hypothetical protein
MMAEPVKTWQEELALPDVPKIIAAVKEVCYL